MAETDRKGPDISRRRRYSATATLGAVALVGVLIFTAVSSEASSPLKSARVAAADTACNSYLTSIQPTTSNSASSNPATIADAYPTTAGNLAAWLLTFDPLAESSAYSSIPPNEEVSACIVKGSWTLPNQGSANVNYEIVMIAPNGTATPRMWGGSSIVNSAPPTVGS
jgi:hypothetical protein